jgi:aminopeptidase N
LARRVGAGLLVCGLAASGAACSGDAFDAGRVGPTTSDAPRNTAPTAPSPTEDEPAGEAGAPGVGDPYFPGLGNGGYDVQHYDLVLDTDGAAVVASATITAVATVPLDTFSLDFVGLEIDAISIDGEAAPFTRALGELVVDPAPVIDDGDTFEVRVDYHGEPGPLPNPVLGQLGWQRAAGATFVASEPDGARTWFPANDHPTDKAGFRFAITVPAGTAAVASGVMTGRTDAADGRTTFVWEHPDAMPTYLATIAFGELVVVESDGPHGVVIRHAFAPRLAEKATRTFADTATMIADLEGIFGPYPFDVYGVLVIDGDLGYALENQTLSLFDRSILDGTDASTRIIVHELAHHWFGNWVTPESWRDIWLNEGFATYAEELWRERTVAGYDIDGSMRALSRRSFGPIGDPGVSGMFSGAVYGRGALTLHALRRTMGDAAFFAFLRAWVDRFGGANASTADLGDLASEVAGTDLRPLIDEWLNNPTMPPLPG